MLLWFLAAALVAYTYPRVAGFTTDSESYLDVARSLLAGQGWVQNVVDFWRPAVPDPLVLWPPAYPTAAAALARLGFPLETAARLVAALGFLVFVWAFYRLARAALGRRGALVLGLVAALPFRVERAAVMAWSEGLFTGFVALALLGLADTGRHRRGEFFWRRALAAGACAGLASLTRYAGIALVPLGIAVLVARRAPRRIWVAWLAPALGLPALWLAHDLATAGRLGGPAHAGAVAGAPAMAREAIGLLRWFALPAPLAANAAIAGLCLGVLALGLVLALRRRGVAAIAAGFTLVYLALLVGFGGAGLFHSFADRYLIPVVPFLWLGAAAGFLQRAHGPAPRTLRGTGGVIAIVAAGLVVAVAVDWVRLARELPAPPPADGARRAELAELRRLVPPGTDPVLSDDGHRVRTATGRPAVQIPGPGFRPRDFTLLDELRWRRAGVTEAVFRRPLGAPAQYGPYLASRLAAGGWTRLDSSAHFLRYAMR